MCRSLLSLCRLNIITILSIVALASLSNCSAPPTANVYITSQPTQAKVFLNGTYLGLTPLYVDVHTHEVYDIELSHPRYHFYQTKQILAKSNTFTLLAQNEPLTLTLTPPPQYLSLDNQVIPPPPTASSPSSPYSSKILLNIAHGTHTLFAFRNNFPPLTKTFTIDAYSPTKLNLNWSTLPYTTQLTLTATPKKSAVYFNNHYLGNTPLTLKNFIAAYHELVIKHPQHTSATTAITLTPNSSQSLHITLAPISNLTDIRFENFPPAATLTLEQAPPQKNSPCPPCIQRTFTSTPNSTIRTSLPPGTYHYKISSPKFYSYEASFTLAATAAQTTVPKEPLTLTLPTLAKLPTTLTPHYVLTLANFHLTSAFRYKKTLYLSKKASPDLIALTFADTQNATTPKFMPPTLAKITTPPPPASLFLPAKCYLYFRPVHFRRNNNFYLIPSKSPAK